MSGQAAAGAASLARAPTRHALQDAPPAHAPVPLPARKSFIWDYGYGYLRALLFVIFSSFSRHVLRFPSPCSVSLLSSHGLLKDLVICLQPEHKAQRPGDS